jgi:hypothetical protein
MDAEDVSSAESPREYIEFYRLDLSSATRRVLVPAALLVAFGSGFVCVAGACLPITVDVPRDLVGFFGAACVLVGLIMGFGGMARLLRSDGFVGLTLEGIHVRVERRDEFVRWDDVGEIRAGGPGKGDGRGRGRATGQSVDLVLRDARSIALPNVSGPKGVVIRDRLEHLRRKASLNLLRG